MTQPTGLPSPTLIGDSAAARMLRRDISLVAESDAPVLIRGESGVGKRLIARVLHDQSPRRSGPFVVFHAAALEASLDADCFAGATGGTVLLDEIGDASLPLQAKLLPLLPHQPLDRPGGRILTCPARVIASTSRDLQSMVQLGSFRKDLFYRLNVFPLHVPPLRERKSDIPMLAEYFLQNASIAAAREIKHISGSAMTLLMSHSWPGNIRQLRDCIEHAVLVAKGDTLTLHHLPPDLVQPAGTGGASGPLGAAVASLESELIVAELKSCGGNMARAARNLGITVSQMRLRVKRYGIDCGQFRHTGETAA